MSRKLVAHLARLFYSMDSDKNPLFSPYWYENFTSFSSTTLLCGEYDALRYDSEAFFEKLKKANAAVEIVILEGQSHNEIVMQGLSSARPDPTEEIAAILRKKIECS